MLALDETIVSCISGMLSSGTFSAGIGLALFGLSMFSDCSVVRVRSGILRSRARSGTFGTCNSGIFMVGPRFVAVLEEDCSLWAP